MVKTPNWKESPVETKTPRRQENPESTDKQTIAWHLNVLDTDGPWGWKSCTDSHFWDVIFEKVRSFETMTWAGILRGGNNHPIKVNQICPEAQKRLIKIRQDDIDEIYSLGLMGKPRLWGIRDGRIFKVLWWDPEHTVCPSFKKHT